MDIFFIFYFISWDTFLARPVVANGHLRYALQFQGSPDLAAALQVCMLCCDYLAYDHLSLNHLIITKPIHLITNCMAANPHSLISICYDFMMKKHYLKHCKRLYHAIYLSSSVAQFIDSLFVCLTIVLQSVGGEVTQFNIVFSSIS